MKHYETVLAEIQAKRESLGVELSELNTLEAGIAKLAGLPTNNGAVVLNLPPNTAPIEQAKGTLKDFSVREAALKVLTQANGPVKVGTLAEILKAGGLRSKGQNFPNQVSNTLSKMVHRKEVVRTTNGYAASAHGRTTWEQLQVGLAKVGI